MRKNAPILVSCALAFVFASSAFAQDNTPPAPNPQPPNSGQVASGAAFAPQNAASSPAQIQNTPQAMSLGELARQARAKKASEPKASRVLNDENFAHALFAAGASAPAISFVGSDSAGSNSMNGSAGHLTLLDFWATWCGPCRHALPGLKQFASSYAGQVEVVSISEDRDEKAWRSFVEQNQMEWAQKIDTTRDLAKQYGVTAFPTYILIDADGKVIQQFVGDDPTMLLADRIGPEVRSALAGKS
jgi:thiol-disulfide isomerase/thioredoxin